jgi:hypothetical protein
MENERARLEQLIETVYCDATGGRMASRTAHSMAAEILGDGYSRASPLPPPGSEAEAAMVERAYAEYRRSREGCAPCLDDFFRASMLTCLRAALTEPKEDTPDA